MKFSSFLLRVDGIRDAELKDFEYVMQVAQDTYDDGKKYYVLDMEIIENRFFWLACEYDDAVRFRDYVVKRDTGEKEPNPRTKDQIEPRQQFFACYDTQTHFLYLNNLDRRPFLQKYLSHVTQMEFSIQNVYTSVKEFCEIVKSIREFRFIQVDNIYARNGNIFKQIGDIWGIDWPTSVYMKVGVGDVPIHQGGSGIVDYFVSRKDEFERVLIVGHDKDNVEQVFDFSSVLKNFNISPTKDENAHYDPYEVRYLLINELR